MQEHSSIELYITLSDEQQNSQVEQALSSIDLDSVVSYTLQAAYITQPVMLNIVNHR